LIEQGSSQFKPCDVSCCVFWDLDSWWNTGSKIETKDELGRRLEHFALLPKLARRSPPADTVRTQRRRSPASCETGAPSANSGLTLSSGAMGVGGDADWLFALAAPCLSAITGVQGNYPVLLGW
jgi:hypothetical protein